MLLSVQIPLSILTSFELEAYMIYLHIQNAQVQYTVQQLTLSSL